jgi:hypothetical protein
VYSFSADGPSAYEAYDGVVLARAPAARLREREAIEFFAGLDANGRPRWSRDLGERRPVLRHPGACRRLDVVHHPGLGRYLMALAFDARGGWALLDAPEPWGPWHVAWFTPYWGLGGTHSYRLPSRWLDAAGGRGTLVFSGKRHEGIDYDAFCVRGLELRRVERAVDPPRAL